MRIIIRRFLPTLRRNLSRKQLPNQPQPNHSPTAFLTTSFQTLAHPLPRPKSHPQQQQPCMVPRPLPYPSHHPTKGIGIPTGTGPLSARNSHFFSVYPSQNHEILRRIYWKRRGYFMAVNIPSLPDVERVSSSVVRILGGNPSKFTLQGTNTYLLGRGRERILVDSGQGFEGWWDRVMGVLDGEGNGKGDGEGCVVRSLVLTHWHHDHVMGVKDVRGHKGSAEAGMKVYKGLGGAYDPDGTLQGQEVLEIVDGQRFQVGSEKDGDLFEVETLHTPGHAKDHMCLIVTRSPDEEEVGCIFTADNVLGHGTAVFEDLATYVKSLHVMKDRVGEGKRAFPGHGAVISDARGKLEEYITHRRMREEEALNVLVYGTTTAPGKESPNTAEGFPQSVPPLEGKGGEAPVGREMALGKEWESIEMVKVIYRMYPESLWGPAEGGLLQVLDKLKSDGKVESTKDAKWKASTSTLEEAIGQLPGRKSPNKL